MKKQAFIYSTVYRGSMNQEETKPDNDVPLCRLAEDEITCPYGYETCDEDDFESMCDGCRQDRAEAWNDARMDTYD